MRPWVTSWDRLETDLPIGSSHLPVAHTPMSMNFYCFRLCFAYLTHVISSTLCSLSRWVRITHLMRQVGIRRTIKEHHRRGGQVGSDGVSCTFIWMMHLWWTCDALVIFRQLFWTCDGHGHEYVDFGLVMDVIYVIYVWLDVIYVWLEVIYEIYVLFPVMECKKNHKKKFIGHFAECCTRQSDPLPSAMAIALGKAGQVCTRALHLPALPSATSIALGKGCHFAKCREAWLSEKFFF
jgi:hypothetical protein